MRGARGRQWRGAGGGGHGRRWGGVPALYVLSPSRPSPLPPKAASRAAAEVRRAHMCCSAVRAPSCVGTVPVRLLL
eukprot:scaffold14048_cov25-Phaeocystis_antarctica.AAC.1